MKKPFATLPVILALAAGAAGIYLFQSEPRKAESLAVATSPAGGVSKDMAKGAIAGFIIHPARKAVENVSFSDGDGKARALKDWKGRVVLLNLWATWCVPCRKEMPDLAKLQRDLGGAEFEVVALSLDRKGAAQSAEFLKITGADNLKTYVDPEGKALTSVGALGLPATLLIDRKGQEVGRILGPAGWASAEAADLVKALVAEAP